jgi:hypothetical protein
MKRWILASLLLSGTAGAQSTETVPPQCTVAQLAAGTCAPAKLGTRVRISNSDSAVDTNCASGTGSNLILCEFDGTTWIQASISETAGPGAANLIENGSFEITDGRGSIASTVQPAGWSDQPGSPSFAYVVTDVSEGAGIAAVVTSTGTGNEGIRQRLFGLKASTAYVFRVRVKAPDIGGCNLFIDDTVTNSIDTSLTTGAFETLETTLTTSALPNIVDMYLRSTDSGDACTWDHATAYQRNAVIASPGRQTCKDNDTSTATTYTGGAFVAVPGISCAVTMPEGAAHVEATGLVVADNDTASPNSLEVELRRDCGSGATSLAWGIGHAAADTDGAGQIQDLVAVPVSDEQAITEPGTTCTYTMRAAGAAGLDWISNDQDADRTSTLILGTTLKVNVIPMR